VVTPEAERSGVTTELSPRGTTFVTGTLFERRSVL